MVVNPPAVNGVQTTTNEAVKDLAIPGVGSVQLPMLVGQQPRGLRMHKKQGVEVRQLQCQSIN